MIWRNEFFHLHARPRTSEDDERSLKRPSRLLQRTIKVLFTVIVNSVFSKIYPFQTAEPSRSLPYNRQTGKKERTKKYILPWEALSNEFLGQKSHNFFRCLIVTPPPSYSSRRRQRRRRRLRRRLKRSSKKNVWSFLHYDVFSITDRPPPPVLKPHASLHWNSRLQVVTCF